jgi:hypothetical protein
MCSSTSSSCAARVRRTLTILRVQEPSGRRNRRSRQGRAEPTPRVIEAQASPTPGSRAARMRRKIDPRKTKPAKRSKRRARIVWMLVSSDCFAGPADNKLPGRFRTGCLVRKRFSDQHFAACARSHWDFGGAALPATLQALGRSGRGFAAQTTETAVRLPCAWPETRPSAPAPSGCSRWSWRRTSGCSPRRARRNPGRRWWQLPCRRATRWPAPSPSSRCA